MSSAASSDALLARVDSLVVDIISRICASTDCTLAFPGAKPLFSTSTDGSFGGARDFEGTLRVLATSASLLRARKTATTRELYYCHATFFNDAKESATAIARVTAALEVPRASLALHAASKGWMAGAVILNGARLSSAAPVSISAEYASGARPHLALDGARFILVVEKECIFRRIVEDRLWDDPGMRCVVVTGGGQPDLATRAMVRFLTDVHGPTVPALALCDANPYGLAIALVYANGSAARPDAAPFAATSLLWLGLRMADIDAFGLPQSVRQRTTSADDSRARALLKDPHVAASASLTAEVNAWVGEPRSKVELEGLHSRGLSFLGSSYLPSKLGLARSGHDGPLNPAFIDALRLDASAAASAAPTVVRVKRRRGRRGDAPPVALDSDDEL